MHRRRLIFFLLASLTSCDSLLAQSTSNTDASSLPTVNVRDFGAKGDGVTDDSTAINRAIAQAGPGASVHIPAGTYLLVATTVHILGASDLTVFGDGPGTILTAKNGHDSVINFDKCRNLTLRKMTLTQSDYYFTQGTVKSVDHQAKSCDITLDPGYPEANAPFISSLTGFRPFTYPDSGVYQQDHYISTIQSRQQLGDHRWHLSMSNRGVEDDWVGKKFIIWNDVQSGHGVHGSATTDCLIEDIDYYGHGANAGFLLSRMEGTTVIRRYNIDVPPGSHGLLSCSGGGQFAAIRGKLVFDHCKFLHFDDDGADIFTSYVRILTQSHPNVLVLQHNNHFQVGDSIAIMNFLSKAERGRAVITQVDPGTDGSCQVTLDQNVTVGKTGPGDGTGRGIPQISDGIDRVVDYNNVTSATEFHDCEFQCLRARPLNLKAQNCLVEGCKFFDCEMPAIAAGPEFYWEEAPAVHHLTVLNCEFTNCDTTNIDVDYFDADPAATESYDNSDILIEGNTFKHYGAYPAVHHYIVGCAIHVRDAEQVTIRNNIFEAPAPTAPSGIPKVLVQHSKNVIIQDNSGLTDAEIKQE